MVSTAVDQIAADTPASSYMYKYSSIHNYILRSTKYHYYYFVWYV